MILYGGDWSLHHGAIVDTQTTNTSFLNMAAKYREAGVANWGMILALQNPNLQGVDPHDETLDVDTKIEVNLEAAQNIWYFLREVFYVPSKAGKDPIRYRANRGNIAIAWLCMNNIDFIHTQPRQTGKSVGMDAINIWLLFLRLESSEISLITKDNGLRVKNIERLKDMRDLLPPYMVVQDRKDKNNSEVITYLAKANEYRTSVAQSSEGGARKVGRGNTTPIFQIDEAPFIENIEITLASALPGGTEAKATARERGEPYFTAITTTAGKRDDRDGSYIYRLIEESARWNDDWFDLPSEVELRKVIKAGGRENSTRVYCCFNHRQLGYSDQWLRDVLAETGSRGPEADRDFFNKWTNGSRSSPLSVELNQLIANSELTAEHTEITPQGYSVRWYIPRDIRHDYLAGRDIIMSMDTSEAIGNDDIGVVFTDASNLATVGAATVNDTNLDDFASWVADVMINNDSITLMFERKSTGLAIFDRVAIRLITAGIDPFRRVFNNIVQQPEIFPNDYTAIKSSRITREFVTQYRRHFGFVTNAENRRFLFTNILQNNAKMGGSRVRDEVLIKQITGLVKKNDRIDHSASGHDDMVIAWLLTGWFLTTGHNLDYYGINSTRVLHDVHVKESESTTERNERMRVQSLENEIEDLCINMASCDDSILLRQLETRLRRAVMKVNQSSNNTRSMAALLDNVAKQREMLTHVDRIGAQSSRRTGSNNTRVVRRERENFTRRVSGRRERGVLDYS